jgi:hypothetical protein
MNWSLLFRLSKSAISQVQGARAAPELMCIAASVAAVRELLWPGTRQLVRSAIDENGDLEDEAR